MPAASRGHWRRRVAGKAAAGRPVSQETRPDHQADTPSRKGVALMNRKTLIALLGAISLTVGASGAALAAGRGPAVTVRIEGSKKTRLLPTVVHTRRGWLTKYGAPRGKCPKRSAQGALNVATHGHWKGTWYASLHEYFITSIL